MFGYIGHCAASSFEAIREPAFSVVFLFLLCFIAHLYEANGGTDMEVLACFRPCFFFIELFMEQSEREEIDIIKLRRFLAQSLRLAECFKKTPISVSISYH